MKKLFKLHLIMLSLLLSLTGIRTKAQSIEVDINLNVKHSVDTCSTFARDKYITLHSRLDDGEWDSDARRDMFFNDYDVYLGRSNGELPWNLTETSEDPDKAGWPDVDQMISRGTSSKSSYGSKTAVHKHEKRNVGMMIGGQWGNYPNGAIVNPNDPEDQQWSLEGYEAAGEYYANFFKYFYGEGGTTGSPKPTYLEVINEPMWNATGHGTTKVGIANFHKVVAKRVRELNPDVKVGGYTGANPAHDDNNFGHWNSSWKMFIDTAGADMDFFSMHLYDKTSIIPKEAKDIQYRSGCNMEAILDMVEHYSLLTLGEVKPFNISEYGFWGRAYDDTPYTKERDWHNIRSFSSMMIQMMERPNTFVKSMPFLIIKANWWKPTQENRYPYRLLRQNKELAGSTGEQWVYTEHVQFYQLWSDVKGIRIDTKPTNLDIQMDAYVDGNKAYVVLNNLIWEDQTIKLNLFGKGDNVITSIVSKQTYENNGVPILEEVTQDNSLSEIELGSQATMVIEYTFENDVIIDETSEEKKYYATEYLKDIVAGQDLTYHINGIDKGGQGEAVLRLGLGRSHSKSLDPTVLINGVAIEVPENFRGYDQKNWDSFFGILEIPVPYALIKENNEVTIRFEDNGGKVSSLFLQIFKMSHDLPRTGEGTAVVSGVSVTPDIITLEVGETLKLAATVVPADAANKLVSWESGAPGIATVHPGGIVAAMAEGTATITVTTLEGGKTATAEITVTKPVGIDRAKLQRLSIYPNPANNNVNIEGLESGVYQVRVYNILGAEKLNSRIIGAPVNSISLTELEQGTYIINVTGDDLSKSFKLNIVN